MGMVPPKGKIDMDEVRTVANNLTKEKQVDKAQSPKVFSVKGVQEIARKIKEQDCRITTKIRNALKLFQDN